MAWPREAIDAAVFTTPVRIDGRIEANIWRVIVSDDRTSLIRLYVGHQTRRCFLPIPPVIDTVYGSTVKSPGRIRERSAPFAWSVN
jgi:hypothetical protein